jgi:hypothetical protein
VFIYVENGMGWSLGKVGGNFLVLNSVISPCLVDRSVVRVMLNKVDIDIHAWTYNYYFCL